MTPFTAHRLQDEAERLRDTLVRCPLMPPTLRGVTLTRIALLEMRITEAAEATKNQERAHESR